MIRRFALAAAVALASAPAFAATYALDPGHTQVVFQWNHFGYSNPTAQFGKVEGTLEFDQADPTKSSVTAKIALSSVNSNVPKLDQLRVHIDAIKPVWRANLDTEWYSTEALTPVFTA